MNRDGTRGREEKRWDKGEWGAVTEQGGMGIGDGTRGSGEKIRDKGEWGREVGHETREGKEMG